MIVWFCLATFVVAVSDNINLIITLLGSKSNVPSLFTFIKG